MLGKRPGDILEEAWPVPGVDCDLDAEALRRASVPVDRREPLRIALEGLDVRAVVPVDRDALAERDVADDLVARDGRAALGEPDEDVGDSLDVDPERVASDRLGRARRLERD